jgi:hypothetical protein
MWHATSREAPHGSSEIGAVGDTQIVFARAGGRKRYEKVYRQNFSVTFDPRAPDETESQRKNSSIYYKNAVEN